MECPENARTALLTPVSRYYQVEDADRPQRGEYPHKTGVCCESLGARRGRHQVGQGTNGGLERKTSWVLAVIAFIAWSGPFDGKSRTER
jgi:hypothetical protein